ncbi:zinc finger protein RFP-like [Podarcis raffonei]|uniref:zinc finger protein RFP-like n=1 Tax=Podarcis raffonei TaxID=65483 RepID=UPI0023297271|nr:zinc finger protein RFP-like [Podarcis raffonei]
MGRKQRHPFAHKKQRKRNHFSLPGEAAAMAAFGGPVQDLCKEATCPICLESFRDPVIIPDCGHNFCRSCLIQCWGESEGEASCPHCREILQHRNLIPNRPLANVLEKLTVGKLHLHGEKEAEGKGKICEKHQEPLKLFCKEDESPICVVCDRSKEHKSHEVIPLEEASQEYKDQISSCLDNVRKEREKILVFKANTEKESQDLLKQMKAEKGKMVAEIRRLHQFLEEQEKLLLAQMAEVEKEIAKKREEHLASLSRELSSLDSLIREMEEKLQEPVSELLQDIRSFLQRSQEKENLEDPPVAFPPALKWRIWDFCDMNPFLEGVMKQFKDTVEYGLQLRKENVTLDTDTAHPFLILSDDRKSVSWGEVCQDLPDNPERFDTYLYVLGCEGFTAGRHFWEVIVGRVDKWAVGVARKSVKRKGVVYFDTSDGIWGFAKWDFGYTPLEAPVPSEEPKRIRVALNCEGRRVSFYDADTAALLYSFSEASFSGETLQPFFYVSEKGNLRLS